MEFPRFEGFQGWNFQGSKAFKVGIFKVSRDPKVGVPKVWAVPIAEMLHSVIET